MEIQQKSICDRYLIALIQTTKVAFPASIVRDILCFKKIQILNIPFYDSTFLGVISHQNQIVPLISGRQIFLAKKHELSQPTLTAVRLNNLGGKLTGVAVIVDRMLEGISATELTNEQIFQTTAISDSLWQLQR